jgi:hypothetical protein
MEVSDAGWNGHKWREVNPRRLQLKAGTPVVPFKNSNPDILMM